MYTNVNVGNTLKSQLTAGRCQPGAERHALQPRRRRVERQRAHRLALVVLVARPARPRHRPQAGHHGPGPDDLVAGPADGLPRPEPERDVDGVAAHGRRDGAPEAGAPDLVGRAAEGARDEHRGLRRLRPVRPDRRQVRRRPRRLGPSPGGARRSRAARSPTTPTDRAAVSVSFGAVEVAGTATLQRTIRVENHGASAQTYALAYDARTSIPASRTPSRAGARCRYRPAAPRRSSSS